MDRNSVKFSIWLFLKPLMLCTPSFEKLNLKLTHCWLNSDHQKTNIFVMHGHKSWHKEWQRSWACGEDFNTHKNRTTSNVFGIKCKKSTLFVWSMFSKKSMAPLLEQLFFAESVFLKKSMFLILEQFFEESIFSTNSMLPIFNISKWLQSSTMFDRATLIPLLALATCLVGGCAPVLMVFVQKV